MEVFVLLGRQMEMPLLQDLLAVVNYYCKQLPLQAIKFRSYCSQVGTGRC